MTPFPQPYSRYLARSQRRLHLLGSLLLVAMLTLAGCGGNAAPSSQDSFIVGENQTTSQPEPASPDTTVALVMKTLTNPFFIEMEKGARRAESELGIRLLVKSAAQETSIEQQIEIVENLIEAQVDAIVIAPGDSVGLIPVLKKAQDAGIALVNIDNQLDAESSAKMGLTGVPFISVDNEEAAYLSAKFISDQIDAPTNVAILEGIRSARNAQDRKNGALRAFEENPNISVVGMETAQWKIDEAEQVTKRLFRKTSDIGALFCANDMMAIGALQYLKQAGRSDVLVAGFDNLGESRPFLDDGSLAVTIDQQAAQQGYLGVQYAVRALEGETLPGETMIDVKVVTTSALD